MLIVLIGLNIIQCYSLTMMFYHKFNESFLFDFTLIPSTRGQNLVTQGNLLYNKLGWS